MQHCEPDATNTLGNPCTGLKNGFGHFAKISPYGQRENPPCVESKWRTCRTNHCSKWVLIDFYFFKESRKTICIEFRSILVKIPPILKRGHLSSTVELRDHLFCDQFAAAVSRALRAGTRKLSLSGNSTNILRGATRTLPIYVTLTWAPSSSASFYRSINDRKPDFWRGTNSISI